MNRVERVKAICAERKIPIYKLEKDLEFGNGYISQLKKGTFPANRLAKIADYLNLSVEFLLTGEEKEKAPSDSGEGGISEKQLKAAFFRGADPTLTDEEIDAMWEDAKDLRDLLIMKMRREKGGK